ncbi:MAG: cyclodeaminase/cyclohydrolase family protein [Anaerolineae bacterium]|jgi:formiminotetrahydrofolate cyclodeaminase
MAIKDGSVQGLLDELAGSSATPGGGSAAALTGAMGAALLSMVCNLTIGKKQFAAVQDELRGVLEEAEALRRQLTSLADADTRAFDQVMAAYRRPKRTEEEKAARQAAIQQALQGATQVPLETAVACAAIIKLTAQVIAKVNPNALSDAGSAALLAEAGLRGAQLNVRINLGSIRDPKFVQEKQKHLAQVLSGASQEKDRVFSYVLEHS